MSPYWPKADMTVRDSDVRFRGQSGHPLGFDECLLMTKPDLATAKNIAAI
jgi:hypothetical protein